MSEYGLQLREKQKAKFIYGVLEKPFLNYFKKADQMSGMTGENQMVLLESRLDNVVFRLGFARTRREARQIVDHKQVLVNGKQVNIPSYLIKAGDVIEIKEGKKSSRVGSSLTVPFRFSISDSSHSGTRRPPVTSTISLYLCEDFLPSLISITSPALMR